MSRRSLKNVCRLIESANTQIPVEKDFLEDLKRSIEITDQKNSRQPSKTYKPSSMNCIRNMYYQVQGYETQSDSNYCLVGICNSGTDTHERIQNYVDGMKDNGMDCIYCDVAEYVKMRNLDYLDIVAQQGNETKLYHKDLNISFLCDGIIKYKGRYYIIEFKTESIYKFQSRQGVNTDHYNQAITYSEALGISDVLFVYICRDNSDMKAYMFNVTDDMRKNLVSRIKECDEYISKSQVPPKPIDVPKKACAYCNYKAYCSQE